MSPLLDTDVFLTQRGSTLHRIAAVDLRPRTPWTPDAIPRTDLLWWLDASDPLTVTLNGSNVSEWRDKATVGASRRFRQVISVSQPLWRTSPFNIVGETAAPTRQVEQDNLTTAVARPYTRIAVHLALPATTTVNSNMVHSVNTDSSDMSAQVLLAAGRGRIGLGPRAGRL
jgi:hypothetical protein